MPVRIEIAQVAVAGFFPVPTDESESGRGREQDDNRHQRQRRNEGEDGKEPGEHAACLAASRDNPCRAAADAQRKAFRCVGQQHGDRRVRADDHQRHGKHRTACPAEFDVQHTEQPTVLILGGLDKGNDYNEIMELVKERVKAIVCLGIDNKPIHDAFDGVIDNVVDTKNAHDAVAAAFSLADKGDAVLLSPACASFDLFKNYEDRGRQFKEAVKAL